MDRDDLVTFGLVLGAASITFLLAGPDDGASIPLAFVVFGAFLFGKSFVSTVRD
ncbi:hypothetical protein [Haladaptatus sp. NG-WS-4]